MLKTFENTNCKLLLDHLYYQNVHFKIFSTDNLAVIGTTNYADKIDKKNVILVYLQKIEISF